MFRIKWMILNEKLYKLLWHFCTRARCCFFKWNNIKCCIIVFSTRRDLTRIEADREANEIIEIRITNGDSHANILMWGPFRALLRSRNDHRLMWVELQSMPRFDAVSAAIVPYLQISRYENCFFAAPIKVLTRTWPIHPIRLFLYAYYYLRHNSTDRHAIGLLTW